MSTDSNLYMSGAVKILTGELDHKSSLLNGSMSVEQTLINQTEFPITVVHRDNVALTTTKDPHINADNTSFILRRVYKIRGLQNIRQVTNNLHKFIQKYGNEDKLIVDLHQGLLAYLKAVAWRTDMYFQFVFDFKIDVPELVEKRNIYYPDLDLLLVLGEYKEEHIHPFSSIGKGLVQYQESLKNTKVSGVFLEVVDNESMISKRYMFLAKQVVEIPVVKDPTRNSGVYYNVVKSDNVNKAVVDQKCYSFQQAQETIGLYSTAEEALTNGDPKKLLDAKIQENELEIQELKRQADLDKIELTRLRDELEVKRAQREDALQQRQASRTIEVEQVKDRVEERSVKRKDRSEMIKLVGTAVVTGLSVAAIMSKRK